VAAAGTRPRRTGPRSRRTRFKVKAYQVQGQGVLVQDQGNPSQEQHHPVQGHDAVVPSGAGCVRRRQKQRGAGRGSGNWARTAGGVIPGVTLPASRSSCPCGAGLLAVALPDASLPGGAVHACAPAGPLPPRHNTGQVRALHPASRHGLGTCAVGRAPCRAGHTSSLEGGDFPSGARRRFPTTVKPGEGCSSHPGRHLKAPA